MKLPLMYYGNPILRKKGERVNAIDDDLRRFVQDMVETLYEHKGVGLAAPQVGRSISLFITHIPKHNEDDTWSQGPLKVFINPKVVSYSEELWGYSEGCLSIPGLYEDVLRPSKVTIQATDLEGNEFIEEFEELGAHVVLHENDHINGVLFIDRLPPKKRKEIDQKLRAIKKKYSS